MFRPTTSSYTISPTTFKSPPIKTSLSKVEIPTKVDNPVILRFLPVTSSYERSPVTFKSPPTVKLPVTVPAPETWTSLKNDCPV